MSRHEKGGNGDEVVGELLRRVNDSFEHGVGLGVGCSALTDHHEPDIVLCKEVLHELDSKARQSVPVKHGNLLDHSLETLVQYGSNALPFPVEATSHVGDDLVVGAEPPEFANLALEVAPLVFARHLSVGKPLSLLLSLLLGASIAPN